MKYDVIIVGAGHAGCEAAHAAAKLNEKVLLITSNIKNIADMPCNPSIGGPAKGIIVREIDALGGLMGKIADRSILQIKMLNTKKGPAVRALRSQADKITYPKEMLKELKNQKSLTILEGMVDSLLTKRNKIEGVILEDNNKYLSKTIILTTGTYMKADILVGDTRTRKGPHDEEPSENLSSSLKELGFKILRLKTGTPQRIEKASIDFSKMNIQSGDAIARFFSFDEQLNYNPKLQIDCHLTYTNQNTHQIINENINKSSMYGGLKDIKGIGPRYCPSIEDKVTRFSDKKRHQLFLEPESLFYDDIYLQGFSTSMPHHIQEKMVHSLEGLENAKIKKYAYAIEYDAIYPTQLKPSLETKIIEGLYTAGQINGTSGYEEAAGQGLLAGINASLKINNKNPLILKRNEAYIGVLIDDLVTKGTKEPYRMLTSRAEYRLLLRHDNADLRIRDYGINLGLIDKRIANKHYQKKEAIKALEKLLKKQIITPTKTTNQLLRSLDSAPIKDKTTLFDLLKRPEITINHLQKIITFNYDKGIEEQVEITAKYEGYIKKAKKEAQKMIDLEEKKIPQNIDYNRIKNLASEAREKLIEIVPESIGQASRISGVNPADISIIMIYLKKGAPDD